MNKAFTKEDTAEAPLIIPARAPLPPGVPNYVTARGLVLLRAELATLDAERARLAAEVSDDAERARRLAVVAGRTTELAARIASAIVVDPKTQPRDEVRFGATVRVRAVEDSGALQGAASGAGRGEERCFTIVGVDEADAAAGRVAFLAPIARALLGLRVGETATFRTGGGDEALVVTAIVYEP